MKEGTSENHRFHGLMDSTELKSKNLCHPGYPEKSVIQTKSAEILNTIFELL
jgi:hypothetical protein